MNKYKIIFNLNRNLKQNRTECNLIIMHENNYLFFTSNQFSWQRQQGILILTFNLKAKYHVHDLQAFCILFVRYLAALMLPTVSRPDTACLALETMTVRLKTFCMHFAASSLEPTTTSCNAAPEIRILSWNNDPVFGLPYCRNYCMPIWSFKTISKKYGVE